MAIGDLNDDGNPTSPPRIKTPIPSRFCSARARAALARASSYAVRRQSHSVAIGDLNGDDKPRRRDRERNDPGTLSILLGRGWAIFGVASGLNVGVYPASVATAI